MSKYTWMFLMAFILIFATFLIDATTLTHSADVGGTVSSGSYVVTARSMVETFFAMIWFKVDGIPPIINLLFFYPPSMVLALIIMDIIKDLIPFT